LCECGRIIKTPEHVLKNCALYAENRSDDWSDGVSMENVRRYLINIMRVLWSEKEEEKSDVNRVRKNRRQRRTAGVPTTGTGPAVTSR